MKKMMAMLLASVMAAGTFATTAFAYTGDDVQKNTSVSTAAQEADAAGSANAGKTDNTDSIEIDPDMQVLPDGYEVSTDADGNLIVTVGGKEYNIGSEKSRKQMGTVVPGITSLHFRSGPGMDQEIIGYLHSGDTVEIVEKCGDWYKVNFNGKTGYAHGKYLNVTDSAKDSSMFSEDALKLFLDLMQSGMSSEDETESSTALTPEGNMTLVDDIGEEEDKSSQQFITLVTKAGNTFYLIIDRDKDGNQNVHFLNMVDEADLLALMDEEEAAKYQEKKPEVTEPAETEKPKETEPAPEEQKTESEQKKASPLPMIMLLLFVIGAAGVGGYLKVTRKNMAENVRQAFDYFAGRKTQTATLMLQSFGVLDGDKIRPEGSKYAAYYIDQLKQLPPQGVINYSDIFDVKYDDQYEDKHFKINYLFTPIIFLSMVYAGYATMTLRNGTVLSASNLDTVPRIGVLDLYEFKYLARPAQMAMAELKKLFDVLEINPALLDNPNDRDEGVKQLLKKAQETSNSAVLANQKLNNGFELWNEPLVDAQHLIAMKKACAAVKDEFSNYSARFNTPAKLNNFTLTFEEIDKLAEQIALIKAIAEYVTFKTDCANNVSYLSNIEFIDLGANFKQKLEAAKDEFRSARDSILTGTSGDAAAQKVNAALEKVKEEYIGIYFEEHRDSDCIQPAFSDPRRGFRHSR